MSLADSPASLSATLHGSIERLISSSTKLSNLLRVIVTFRCLGPVASAVTYGKFTVVLVELDSSILAFSAASFKRYSARTSLLRSTPDSFINSSIM